MNSPSPANSQLPEALAFLGSIPLFAEVDRETLSDISARIQFRTFGNGMTLFHQDMPGMTLYMIAEGYVRLYSMGQTGQEFTYYIYGPTEVFGELSLLDNGYHAASCITLTPIKIWLLSKDHLFEVLQEYPAINIRLLRIIASRVRSTTRKAEAMAFQDVQGRLAYEMLDLEKKCGHEAEEGILIDIPLNQNDLASMVGATRESVNKALSTFRSKNLIKMSGPNIVITDRRGLEQMLL
jgi:CRP/FNR family cyclic AMP-dependent transcriptional regulator